MRIALIILISTPGCAPAQVTPQRDCAAVADTAQVAADALAGLAGTYEVVFVNSEGEYGDSLGKGTLTLWANDSSRRFASVSDGRALGRFPGERPVAGKFVSQSALVASYPNTYDPDRPNQPAIEMIGHTIYFGGIDMLDGSGERLEITRVRRDGFVGRWHYDGGIAIVVDTMKGRRVRDPGGYFCAQRTG